MALPGSPPGPQLWGHGFPPAEATGFSCFLQGHPQGVEHTVAPWPGWPPTLVSVYGLLQSRELFTEALRTLCSAPPNAGQAGVLLKGCNAFDSALTPPQHPDMCTGESRRPPHLVPGPWSLGDRDCHIPHSSFFGSRPTLEQMGFWLPRPHIHSPSGLFSSTLRKYVFPQGRE